MSDTPESITDSLIDALNARGFNPVRVHSANDARELVLSLIPDGALVAHGGSMTLREIGLVDALASSNRVRYGNAQWLAENDPHKRQALRKAISYSADFYLGSVQAITRDGHVVGADQSGGRQAPYLWGPRHVIWIAGQNKIVDTLDDALVRLQHVAFPKEDARIKSQGGKGSGVNKIAIYAREPDPQRITTVLVDQDLGF
ncbi:MAG: lactate utilization protein [Vulcanimicrobiaceae bacterium]